MTVVFPRPPTAKKKKKKETKDEATVVEAVPSFPKPLLPNLPESQIGGSFKTRILKPLSDVTKEDVLDALPPSFTGGRRTWESVCIKARDVMFAQIGQIVGGDTSSSNNPTPKDVNERTMVAEYLKVCLQEYVDGGCVPPEWGLPFSKQGKGENNISKESKKETNGNDDGNNGIEKNNDAKDKESMDEKFGKGNFVFRRPIENDHDEKKEDGAEAAGK